MTPDILDRVRDLRPDPAQLAQRWPLAARAELAAQLTQPTPTGRSGRTARRIGVAAALVATAAAAAVAVPALLPDGAPGAAGPAAAAALQQLARVVTTAPIDVAGAGEFTHTVVHEHQVGLFDGQTPADLTTSYESWTAADGRLWRRQSTPGAATVTLYFDAGQGSASYQAALPTEAGALQQYLRRTVTGSDSTDEAVFVAVGDLLRGGTAPAALRAAAVTVLARTPHVELGPAHQDASGRAVQEFDYTATARPGVLQSMFIDPATAQVTDERTTGPSGSDTSTVQVCDIVDAVPAEVLRSAVPQ